MNRPIETPPTGPHDYNPGSLSGKCVDCPPVGNTGCLWCGHVRSEHTGERYVDPAVLKHFTAEAPGPIGGEPVVVSTVKWTPTACGVEHCACRRYETRGR